MICDSNTFVSYSQFLEQVTLVTGEGGNHFLNWFLNWYNLKRPVHYLKSKQDRHGSVIYEIRLNFIRLNRLDLCILVRKYGMIWKLKAEKHFFHLKVNVKNIFYHYKVVVLYI